MCVCVMLVSRTYRDIGPSGDGSLEQSCVCVCANYQRRTHNIGNIDPLFWRRKEALAGPSGAGRKGFSIKVG